MEWMEKRDINFSNTDLAVRLDLISKVHGVTAAENFFNNFSPKFQTRNTYGALLNTYCKLKLTEKALSLFEDIEAKNFTTSLSFNNIMTLYIGLDQPEKIPSLVEEMKKRKIPLSTFTYNIWMQSFSILGDINGVERVFEEITRDEKETCNWTTYSNIAAAYIKAGLREKAESVLKTLENEMGPPSREAYHFLITFYSVLNNKEEVNRVSNVLKSSFETTSNVSYNIILQALGKVNDLEGMKKCFEEWESYCTYYDTRVANVVIGSYLRHNMIKEAELIFHGSVKKSNGPFVQTLALFMKHYLANQQIDMALKCLEMAASRIGTSNWYPHSDSIETFMKHFEKEKDIEGAEKLYEISKKLNCVDDKVYGFLLQTYIAAGIRNLSDIRQRIEIAGVLVTPELENMLKNVCSEKVSKLRSFRKTVRTSSVKAVYSGDYSAINKNSRQGLWSIREDVQVPSSPYFPTYAQGQGPPPMMQERFQSVISQLFQYRIIRCGGAVDDDMANIIVAQLLYLDAVDPNKDIVMYVNSPGGSVTAGMAIFDTIKHIRPDVSTVCVGLAASMGAFLLGAGTKGKRYSLPNSRIMIHQPLGGAQGGQTDLDIQANEMLHHKANLNGYLAYHTGQSLDRINQDTDRDYFMSAKEAKEYGLIDGVIMNPLKALQPLAAV